MTNLITNAHTGLGVIPKEVKSEANQELKVVVSKWLWS